MVETVLDVMRVPASGDPLVAVRPVGEETTKMVECDVLVVGGGMGGVAAAWAAARRGKSVHLLEETDWLGGQITSQGVSALDEHEHIEGFGGTRTYYALREAIRDHYRSLLSVPEGDGPFNPGSSWVSRLAFEPQVALAVLKRLLAPEVESGRLQVHLRTKATGATVAGDR
ncbi:MAG: FAD-dependent oxidoreductase, partial [SAR202 cluster bacterium]|nr:FAD-dependent oxidoreductase [SAR202 cluster bacterium]